MWGELYTLQAMGGVLFIIVRGGPLPQAQRVWVVRSFKIEGGAEINPDVLGWMFPLLWSSAVLTYVPSLVVSQLSLPSPCRR